MDKTLVILLSLTIVLSTSCKKARRVHKSNHQATKEYLHLSHTRTNVNPKMDSISESIDYSEYDMLWLGGDLAYLTSEDDQTMLHVDSIYDLGNKNTLWSLGNHDYSDLARIRKFTHRPAYYSFHSNGISFIVLDTQDSLSNIAGAQKAFFEGIVDTVHSSTHVIILHHKLIWMYGNIELEPRISSISNGESGECFYCINPNNFYSDIYPKLLEVKKRGIEVICIGGDIGIKAKEFEYITADGIYFLASGISSGSTENKALLFHHDTLSKTLRWEYKLTSELNRAKL